MFCPKCGANAGNSNFCPKCGYNLGDVPVDLMHASHQPAQQTQHVPILTPTQPKKKKRKGCLIGAMSFFITIIVVTVVVAAVASKNPGTFQSVGNASKQSSSDAAQSEGAPAPIGSAVSNGKISIKVNSVSEVSKIEDETGLTYYKPSDGAKFIVVNLTAENVGTEMYSFLCNNFQVMSKDNKQYSPSVMLAKDYLNTGTINPGLSETGYIAYEVPQALKATDLTLEFQEFLSINKAKFALSGSTTKVATDASISTSPITINSTPFYVPPVVGIG